MKGINNWCLSRQLWWGHQIPCYFAQIEGKQHNKTNDDLWFFSRTEEEAWSKAKKALGGKQFTFKQDKNVLDTWFSSGLWPFSTLGWSEQTSNLVKLYSTSLLETEWDILLF